MVIRIKSLILSFCFILAPAISAQAFECGSFLVQSKADVSLNKIKSIKYLFHFNKVSKTLDEAEKQLIKKKINELEQMTSAFTQSYNQTLENYGTDFLDDLRDVFESEDAFLRRNTQLLINELRRFMNQNGELTFRQLDLLPRIRTLSKSWGVSYLDHPKNVYFNLSFFVTSRLSSGEYQNGYVFSEDNSEVLNKPVFVLQNSATEQPENGPDLFYPGSQTLIPRISDHLVFPGLPLDKDLLAFLTAHGNSYGRVRLAAFNHRKTQKNILGNFVSYFQTQQKVPIFNSRWSVSRKSYFSIFNSNGTVNNELFDLGNYVERKGHLMIPTLPVVWIQNRRGFLPKTEDQLRTGLEAIEVESADFSVAPTPFEFLVAFTELYRPNL